MTLKLLLIAMLLLSLADSSQAAETTTAEAGARQSTTKIAPPTPEPPGGCSAAPLGGMCIHVVGKQVDKEFCALNRDNCIKPHTSGWSYLEGDDRCRGELTCPKVDAVDRNEDAYYARIIAYPRKGGEAKDVQIDNPPCYPNDTSAHCQWVCLDAPNGRRFDVKALAFFAKEEHAGGGCLTDWNKTYKTCQQHDGECNIGWSGWEARMVTETRICGRFKNWSHDRDRCAMIKGTTVP